MAAKYTAGRHTNAGGVSSLLGVVLFSLVVATGTVAAAGLIGAFGYTRYVQYLVVDISSFTRDTKSDGVGLDASCGGVNVDRLNVDERRHNGGPSACPQRSLVRRCSQSWSLSLSIFDGAGQGWQTFVRLPKNRKWWQKGLTIMVGIVRLSIGGLGNVVQDCTGVRTRYEIVPRS